MIKYVVLLKMGNLISWKQRDKITCMVCAYESGDPYTFSQDHNQWCKPDMR